MNPVLAKDEASPWAKAFRGWWLVVFGLACSVAAGRLGTWLGQKFLLLEDCPGNNPPWYFIRQDALAGACSFGALVICLLVAVLARNRYPVYANMLAWMSVLWSGGSSWTAIVILWKTQHLMDPALATTRWTSFETYLYDPDILGGQLVAYLLVLGIVMLGSFRLRRIGERARPTSEAAPP